MSKAISVLRDKKELRSTNKKSIRLRRPKNGSIYRFSANKTPKKPKANNAPPNRKTHCTNKLSTREKLRDSEPRSRRKCGSSNYLRRNSKSMRSWRNI